MGMMNGIAMANKLFDLGTKAWIAQGMGAFKW
jgi:hypothetical protein